MAASLTLERSIGALKRRLLAWELMALEGRIHPEPDKALLLFASPRGGSTWLEEMLATIPRVATIWEPLDIVNNPVVGKLGFWWRQHIPENADWPEAEAMFTDLFSGRTLSPYLARATTPRELRMADRLLVKFVRGNLLLPWITKHFDLPKPVLLVRHPCAVVASMKKFGVWDGLHREPPPPPHRHDDVLRSMLERIGPTPTPAEYLARVWCINNAWILAHPRNGSDWTTVTYEELVIDPEATLARIFKEWNMEPPPRALELARRPSKTTLSGSPVTDPLAQLEHWRKTLNSHEQHQILSVIARCGVELYDEELLPKRMRSRPGDSDIR
ncbi:MAG: sulfotransferase [Flavobacteriales bacterium]